MNNRVVLFPADEVGVVASALASELRRRILVLLLGDELNVNEIAAALKIPQSTAATNVLLLEKAKLVTTRQVSGRKGAQKVCSATGDEVVMRLAPDGVVTAGNVIETEMPVGIFTDFQASTPCGLLSSTGAIGYYDHVGSFLDPHRATAQLIWFAHGFLEYRFPKNIPNGARVAAVSVTAEVCSEYPGSNPDWPSDITVWVNDVEVGTWTSPGDMGDRRGALTPEWWSVSDTQYGFLKTWKTTRECSLIDGTRCSGTTLGQLALNDHQHITVRIGVKEDALNRGGMNLFGRGFGNYEKDIVLQLQIER